MDILVITTGGTFDKVYLDAKSDYQVGEPYVGNLLEEGNVTLNYEILSILKKDSLDIKEEDRILIKDKVSSATQDKIVIMHCVTEYPTEHKYLNLRVIRILNKLVFSQ